MLRSRSVRVTGEHMATIPIFVSSTFQDFHDERDIIRERVAPQLDAVAHPWGSRVEFVDLRWGIDTGDAADDAASRHVLQYCLKEIDRCHPLFVGLVGDRFGWVPPRELLVDAHREAEALARQHHQVFADPVGQEPPEGPAIGLSVTALELWRGAFARDVDVVFALRTLAGPQRRPLNATTAPRGWWKDHTGIEWMRKQIRQRATERLSTALIEYTAQVEPQPTGTRLSGRDMDDFADRLVRALEPLIVTRARALCGPSQSSYEVAARSLVEDRSLVLVGRESQLEQVDQHVGQRNGVVLSGPSGVGKTSLLIAVCQRAACRGVKVAQVFIGAGPNSTSTEQVIGIAAPQLGLTVPPGELDRDTGENTRRDHQSLTGEALTKWWADALSSIKHPWLLAIDGLDRLDPGDCRDKLDLLRWALPQLGALITTTAMDSQAAHLETHGLVAMSVPHLSPEAIAGACRAWAAAEGARELPDRVVAELSKHEQSAFWARTAVSELGWSRKPDFRTAEEATEAGRHKGHAVTDMLTNAAADLPTEDLALAGRLLDRARTLFNSPAAAERFLTALAVTRSGLTTRDLVSLSEAEQGYVLAARWTIGSHLRVLDADGRLQFDHDLFRDAICSAWSCETRQSAHGMVASYLATQADSATAMDGMPQPVLVGDRLWHAMLSADPHETCRAINAAAADATMHREAMAVVVSAIVAGRENDQPALAACASVADHPDACFSDDALDLLLGVCDTALVKHSLAEPEIHLLACVLHLLANARTGAAEPDRYSLRTRWKSARVLGLVTQVRGNLALADDILAHAASSMLMNLAPDTPVDHQSHEDMVESLLDVAKVAFENSDRDKARVFSTACLGAIDMARAEGHYFPPCLQEQRVRALLVAARVAGKHEPKAALTYAWLACEQAYQLSLAIPDEPTNVRLGLHCAVAAAYAAEHSGDLRAARRAAVLALTIAEGIRRSDPLNGGALLDLATVLNNLGHIDSRLGEDAQSSIDRFRESIVLIEPMVESDEYDTRAREALAASHTGLGLAFVGLNMDEAKTNLTKANQLLRPLLSSQPDFRRASTFETLLGSMIVLWGLLRGNDGRVPNSDSMEMLRQLVGLARTMKECGFDPPGFVVEAESLLERDVALRTRSDPDHAARVLLTNLVRDAEAQSIGTRQGNGGIEAWAAVARHMDSARARGINLGLDASTEADYRRRATARPRRTGGWRFGLFQRRNHD